MTTSGDSSQDVRSATVGEQRGPLAGGFTSDESAAGPPAPKTWQQQFLSILNNTAKTSTADGPVRDRGFAVLTHGSASLQHVQALCHSPEQSFNTCMTARYRLNPPVVSNLLAAFVTDLARLARGTEASPPVGDLLPPTRSLTSPPWITLKDGPFTELAERAGLDQPAGELTASWIEELFTALGTDTVLGRGMRLVLFAEVDGTVGQVDMADLLNLVDLPERVGVVVSGVPALPLPPDLVWSAEAFGLTGFYADLDIEPAKIGRAFSYVEAPLTGDQPADLDVLDRRRYARGLARLVMLPDTGPMTIGVHAPWGRGKSSFMRFIEWELVRIADANLTQHDAQRALVSAEQTLADSAASSAGRKAALVERQRILKTMEDNAVRDVIPVWFNAWRYDGATQIWAGLTHEITERMERTLPRNRRLRTRVAYAVANQGSSFWFGAVAPAAAACFLALLVLVLGLGKVRTDIADELPGWAGWLAAIAPAAATVSIGLYLVWRFSRVLTPVSERLLDYVRQPDYRQHMGYQHQVLRDIEFLNGRLAYKGKQPRIVIFIDDLDRCSDEKVLETLQAINLLLTASGFYVFLGIDTHMIAQAVKREYELAEADISRAESYLRKIIQLSFRLPEPERDQRFALLAEFFSEEARREHVERRGPQPAERTDRTAGQEAEQWRAGDPDLPNAPYSWNSLSVRTPPVFEIAPVKDTADELDAFARLSDALPDNPRELKRLGNVHRLVKILVQRPEAPPTAADQRLLVAWLIFCFEHRDAAEKLLHDARDANDETVLHAPDLDALIAKLNTGEGEGGATVLTAVQLAAGTQLAEAAAISSLFQDDDDAVIMEDPRD
jgi:hypothetical protein